MRWLANNLGLLLLAFIFAALVWLVASLQQDPIAEETFVAPVVSQPLQPELVVSSSSLPSSVQVRVRAPRSVLDQLRGAGLRVVVNLTELQPGTHAVSLEPSLNVKPAAIVQVRPPTAAVTIEPLVSAKFPIRVVLIGAPAIGYHALAPKVDVSEAVVSATQQVISQVEGVQASVVLEGARASIEQTVKLEAVDRNGAVVSNTTIRPETAVVRVSLEQLGNYRDLAVRMRIRGQPAEGYAVTSVDYSPQVVTVFGPSETLQKLPGFVETLEVSLEGATADIEKRVGLNLPSGVSLVGDNLSVLVQVRVEPQQGARTVTRVPVVVGNLPAFKVILSPPTVDIVLAGPLPVLNSLREDDVRLFVNVAGLSAGSHTITPTVEVLPSLVVQSMLPAQVQVELRNSEG